MIVFHKNVIHQQCVENVLFDLIWTNLMFGVTYLTWFLAYSLVTDVASISAEIDFWIIIQVGNGVWIQKKYYINDKWLWKTTLSSTFLGSSWIIWFNSKLNSILLFNGAGGYYIPHIFISSTITKIIYPI